MSATPDQFHLKRLIFILNQLAIVMLLKKHELLLTCAAAVVLVTADRGRDGRPVRSGILHLKIHEIDQADLLGLSEDRFDIEFWIQLLIGRKLL